MNDGNGVPIQITEGGTVNVTAGKGFSGDFGMPGVPATVPYTAASHVFDFYEDPAGPTWAILGVGAIRFHGGAGTDSQYIALEAPALATTFTWTLPTAQAAAAGPEAILIDSTGAMSYAGLPVGLGVLPKVMMQTAAGVVSWGPQTDPTTAAGWVLYTDNTGVLNAAQAASSGGIIVSSGFLTLVVGGVSPEFLTDCGPTTNTSGAITFTVNNTGAFHDIAGGPTISVGFTGGAGQHRPLFLYCDLVDFAASSSGGADTFNLYYHVHSGAGDVYYPAYDPLINQPQYEITDTGQPYLQDPFASTPRYGPPLLLAAGTYTVTLAWNASADGDGATYTATSITLKGYFT